VALPKWLQKNTLMFGGIGAGVLLALIVGFVLFRRRSKAAGAAEMNAAASLAAGAKSTPTSPDDLQRQIEGRMAEQHAENARQEVEALMALKIPVVKTKKTEVLVKHIATEAKTDADGLASVVRTWLNG